MADHVVFIDGQSLTGKILNEEFRIQTFYADLTIEREHIARIHFDILYSEYEDEMVLWKTDVLRGLVVVDTIEFDTETGDRLNLPKEIINTLAFRFLAKDMKPLSSYTRDSD